MSDTLAAHRLRLLSSTAETADVRTFTFESVGSTLPAYRPGQAMTLVLDIDGRPTLRSFSLAAPPDRDGFLRMTIKSQPKHGATRWMHDHLRRGATVEARGPHGRFVLPEVVPARLALVSAGSGASPLMAMLRHLEATAPETDVAWVHAARTAADILFVTDLARLQAVMPRLTVTVTLSRPAPGWFGYRGRVTRRLLASAVPDLGQRTSFCCGPHAFMSEVRRIHAAEGGGADDFHVEHFSPAPASVESTLKERAPSARACRVRMGGKTFTVEPGESLLEAATRQVVVIPYGCASGLCGTCRTRLLEGEVVMRHQGGLAPEEEAEGFILACSARPLTDLVLAS
jgi:glycine betaine catabolism B